MKETDFIWWSFLIGIASMVAVTFLLRLIMYRLAKWFSHIPRTGKPSPKGIFSTVEWLYMPISLDYVLAAHAKKKIEKEASSEGASTKEKNKGSKPDTEAEKAIKSSKGNYIRTANTVNRIASFVLAVGAVSVRIFGNGVWCNILLGALAYRTLSRTMEINFSFVKDIASEGHTSDLKAGDRISLAVKSLLEEAALFAGMYCFLFAEGSWLQAIVSGFYSFTTDAVSNADGWVALTSVYQKTCTSILVVLCIASYISGRKEEAAQPARMEIQKDKRTQAKVK